MGYGSITTAMTQGLSVFMIQVEADVSHGLPVFHMVGYLSSEVKEASERVRTAIKNSNIQLQAKKAVVNLSPAALRKKGSSFDLPIAISILVSALEVFPDRTKDAFFAGELSLDGSLIRIKGVLPMVLKAKEEGIKHFFLPMANVSEACLVEDIIVYGADKLQEVCDHLNEDCELKSFTLKDFSLQKTDFIPHHKEALDYADIQGQIPAKRAAEIAVAGGHNMLLLGPPGSGKTMIASRIPSIAPPLTQEESLELTKIYSIMGLLSEEQPLITTRPFRSVHHTATKSALVGGGVHVTPGEISLAHHGVLFLDELPEFPRHVIEVLRQPLEDKIIHLSRNSGSYTYPAHFTLISAMNPCPCGAYPDYNRCTCSPNHIHQYLSKISQPFLDRIDICIEAPKIGYEELSTYHISDIDTPQPEQAVYYQSKYMRERIIKARAIQQKRYELHRLSKLTFYEVIPTQSSYTNSAMSLDEIREFCKLDAQGSSLMKDAFYNMNLTARSYHKILKVARTIADLEGSEQIHVHHLTEAISYRGLDKRNWGRM